jgi:anaphase-promoting complex subunit 10
MVTSSRASHDVGRILESSLDTFWQSEGPLPHILTVQFPRLVALTELRIYLDIKQDESYTPLEILIRVGLHRNDLCDLCTIELDRPSGWTSASLLDIDDQPFPTSVLQLIVLSNYQDGRDTRIRSIRIFGLNEDK